MPYQMHTHKVSMVIPCYNKAPYIAEMFDSVLAQDYDNIELIIVDDGSTDGTSDIIKGYENKFSERGFQVEVIHKQNAGVALAVQSGLFRVTGDFVCFPDCDDILHADYVSKMAEYLSTHEDCEAVRCRAPSENVRDLTIPCDIFVSCLLGASVNTVWLLMVRKSFLDRMEVAKNFSKMKCDTQEAPLVIPVTYYAKNLAQIDDVLYEYRIVDGIMTKAANDNNSRYGFYKHFYDEFAKMIDVYHIPAKYKIIAEYRFYNTVRNILPQSEIDAYLSTIPHKFGEDVPNTFPEIHEYLVNKLLQIRVKKDFIESIPGRVVFYGVLGKIFARNSKLLSDSEFYPDLMMDKGAAPETKINGETIYPPDKSLLCDNDTIIIFPKSKDIINEVRDTLTDSEKNIAAYPFSELLVGEFRHEIVSEKTHGVN